MNKKILIGVLAALILVTISFASAVTANTRIAQKKNHNYEIRTKLATGERL